MSHQVDRLIEKGIVNIGDVLPIIKVFKKAMLREDISIGFIGGSITMGSLSSSPEKCYAYWVYNWWKTQFPQCKVSYINTGIGATDSHFGVARVKGDLLDEKPDVVFIEYSVNDKANIYYSQTYEGLIRKTLKSSCKPAVILVNSVRYDNGTNAQEVHNLIGEYYELPIISMKDSIYSEIQQGNIKAQDITPDNIHPNDKGHKLMANIIVGYLNRLFTKFNNVKEQDLANDISVRDKKPITDNRYEDSVCYQNYNSYPKLQGFTSDKSEKKDICDIFKLGWYGKSVGDKIKFNIVGENIAVQYKKSVTKKAPVAYAYVDGNVNNKIELNGNHNEDWGDCLYLEQILCDGGAVEHQIEIEIAEVPKDCQDDFYLVSVIASKR